MKNTRWLNAVLIIAAIIISFFLITGDQLIELMESNSDSDSKKFSLEVFENNQKEVEVDSSQTESPVFINDEIIALSGVEDGCVRPEAFLGYSGQEIENTLYVVFKDEKLLYGSRIRYKDLQFYLDEDGICYGIGSKNSPILGIDLPIKRSEFLKLTGQPISEDKSSTYYKLGDLVVFTMDKENYVETVFASSSFEGALSMTLNLENHINNDMVKYLYYTPEEVEIDLGKPTVTELMDKTIHTYDSFGIEIHYNRDGNTVLVFRNGGFGVSVGRDEAFLENDYVTTYEKIHDEDGVTYSFKIGVYTIAVYVEGKLVKNVELSK